MEQLKRCEKWLGNDRFKAWTLSPVALLASSYFWHPGGLGETWHSLISLHIRICWRWIAQAIQQCADDEYHLG